MALKSFRLVMLTLLVPLLFSNFFSVSTFHLVIFEFQIIVYTMLTLYLLL